LTCNNPANTTPAIDGRIHCNPVAPPVLDGVWNLTSLAKRARTLVSLGCALAWRRSLSSSHFPGYQHERHFRHKHRCPSLSLSYIVVQLFGNDITTNLVYSKPYWRWLGSTRKRGVLHLYRRLVLILSTRFGSMSPFKGRFDQGG